jgi:hypothetical protein
VNSSLDSNCGSNASAGTTIGDLALFLAIISIGPCLQGKSSRQEVVECCTRHSVVCRTSMLGDERDKVTSVITTPKQRDEEKEHRRRERFLAYFSAAKSLSGKPAARIIRQKSTSGRLRGATRGAKAVSRGGAGSTREKQERCAFDSENFRRLISSEVGQACHLTFGPFPRCARKTRHERLFLFSGFSKRDSPAGRTWVRQRKHICGRRRRKMALAHNRNVVGILQDRECCKEDVSLVKNAVLAV